MRTKSCSGLCIPQHFLEMNRWDCVTRQNLTSEARLSWDIPTDHRGLHRQRLQNHAVKYVFVSLAVFLKRKQQKQGPYVSLLVFMYIGIICIHLCGLNPHS